MQLHFFHPYQFGNAKNMIIQDQAWSQSDILNVHNLSDTHTCTTKLGLSNGPNIEPVFNKQGPV